LFSASVKEARLRPSKTSSRGLNGKRNLKPPKEKSSARVIAAIAGVPVGIASIIVTNAQAVTSEERRVESDR
jgi:hypothetical protein